jgi:hypothetical protein
MEKQEEWYRNGSSVVSSSMEAWAMDNGFLFERRDSA